MKEFSLSDFRLFAKAVELGGLTQAADVLKVPKASASRQLQRLEATVGHLLLHRGGTHFGLTEEGREFLLTAQKVLTTLDHAMANMTVGDTILTGQLRIAIPSYLGRELLAPHLPPFIAAHPALEIIVESGHADVDLLRDEADVAIRAGREGCDEMVARHLTSEPMVLCAAPGYLARHPAVETPSDLALHFVLAALTGAREGREKEITIHTPEAAHPIAVGGVFRANDPELLLRLALTGTGIALMPRALARVAIENRSLVQVLAPWALAPQEINLVYLPGRRRSPKVRVFVAHLLSAFRSD